MKLPKTISKSAAKKIGDALDVDWNEIDLDQFRKGIKVEFEHGTELGPDTNVTGDSLEKTAKIALAHLKELPDYYTKLAKIEERKMTKKELQIIIESIVEETLQQEDRTRRDSHPLFAPDGAGGLSKDELNKALQRQKEKKLRMDAQRKRAAIKSDLREEEEICEDYDRVDEVRQLLQEVIPEAKKFLEKTKQIEGALANTPGTENLRGALEYHCEQWATALSLLNKKMR